jgi:mRNA-degrading endonuclease RelE of RelBE toxin-antitoxin system
MSYSILSIPPFERQLKRLAKKYPSILSDLGSLAEELEVNPKLGIPLGHNCYKIRLAISSKGRGKSGGARVITYVYFEADSIFLLAIYVKSEQKSISDEALKELILHIDS